MKSKGLSICNTDNSITSCKALENHWKCAWKCTAIPVEKSRKLAPFQEQKSNWCVSHRTNLSTGLIWLPSFPETGRWAVQVGARRFVSSIAPWHVCQLPYLETQFPSKKYKKFHWHSCHAKSCDGGGGWEPPCRIEKYSKCTIVKLWKHSTARAQVCKNLKLAELRLENSTKMCRKIF